MNCLEQQRLIPLLLGAGDAIVISKKKILCRPELSSGGRDRGLGQRQSLRPTTVAAAEPTCELYLHRMHQNMTRVQRVCFVSVEICRARWAFCETPNGLAALLYFFLIFFFFLFSLCSESETAVQSPGVQLALTL